jgi:hypothetical protein
MRTASGFFAAASLTIRVEIGPVDRHLDAGARFHDVGHPVAQSGIDVDTLIGQWPVDLLDRVFGD